MKQLVDLLGSLLTKISHEEENIFIIDNILTIPHYLLRTCSHSRYYEMIILCIYIYPQFFINHFLRIGDIR